MIVMHVADNGIGPNQASNRQARPATAEGQSGDGPSGSTEQARLSFGGLARSVLRLWPRLIVAYALVALLLYFCWPTIAGLVSHLARSLILVLNPIPYMGDLGWTESGYRYSDRILMGEAFAPLTLLLFVFGFPLGFALALPGLRTMKYWWRVFWASVTSIGVCSVVLAIFVDLRITRNLGTINIKIHDPWYDRWWPLVVENDAVWDLTMDLYPLAACLLLARAAFVPRGSNSKPFRPLARLGGRRRFFRGNIAALVGLLLLFSAAELRVQQLGEPPREEILEALAERNPELGQSFMLFANLLAKRGRYRAAMYWYDEASTYKGYGWRGQARIREIRRQLRGNLQTKNES